MDLVPEYMAESLKKYFTERRSERTRMLGESESLLSLFMSLIPELQEIQATEEEVRENLQLSHNIDLFDVYSHRAACANCNYERGEDCPFIARTYKIFRDPKGILVHDLPYSDCHLRPEPWKVEKIDGLMQAMKIPHIFRDVTVNSYKPRGDNQKDAKRKVVEYVQDFMNNAIDGRGFILAGPTGTGKTHLAIASGKAIIKEYLRQVIFVDVGAFCSDFSYGAREFSHKTKSIERMKGTDVLILDDLGAEQALSSAGKSTGKEVIMNVIRHRYNAALPTIYTTNMKPEEIEKYLDQRLYSRVVSKCESIPVGGSDYRMGPDPWVGLGKEV
jgi:DNA replication protein DnaC